MESDSDTSLRIHRVMGSDSGNARSAWLRVTEIDGGGSHWTWHKVMESDSGDAHSACILLVRSWACFWKYLMWGKPYICIILGSFQLFFQFNRFLMSFAFSSPSGILIIWLFVHVMVSHASYGFFIILSSFFSDWIISKVVSSRTNNSSAWSTLIFNLSVVSFYYIDWNF